MGTAKELSLSALTGLTTVNDAVNGSGQPATETLSAPGAHEQSSCGANVIAMLQLWPAVDEVRNDEQLSDSVKFGSSVKSLWLVVEGRKLSVRFVSGAESGGWLLVSVTVCVTGVPSPFGGEFCGVHTNCWGENEIVGGDKVTGCWHAVVLFNARHM